MKIDGIMNEFEAIPENKRPPTLIIVSVGTPATNIAVWEAHPDEAISLAFEWLSVKNPDVLLYEDDLEDYYEEVAADLGLDWPPDDWDAEVKVKRIVEEGLIQFEGGFLSEDEVDTVRIDSESTLYARVYVQTVDLLAKSGHIDDRDITKINALANDLNIDIEVY